MGRKDRISQLPASIRQAIDDWLRDSTLTQAEVRERTNDLIDTLNDTLPEGEQIAPLSVGGFNRFAKRMAEVGSRLRERHEIAALWIGKFGRLPQGQLGQLIIQMVHGLAFDASVQLSEGGFDPEDMPGMVRVLKDLALTIEKTERASSLNAEREAEIREQQRLADAEKLRQIEDKDRRGGKRALDPETLRRIREEVYGIVEVG